MRKQDWENMSEMDFEEMLTQSLPESLPEEVTGSVTPWKKAVNQVLWGIGLTTAKLDFLGLNDILPAIGMLLMLLGFRSLRRENKVFRNCFVVSVLRMGYFIANCILDTTVYRSVFQNSAAGHFMTIGMCLVQLVQMFYFWQGFLIVQKKVQMEPSAPGAVGLLAWYAVAVVLVCLAYEGIVIAWAMVIGFFVVIYSLCKLSKALDQAGYAVQPVKIRVSDQGICAIFAGVLVIGCACGYLFGSSYKMQWEATEETTTQQVSQFKAYLVELGLPEYVVNDLALEDIARCEGAEQIALQVKNYPFDKGQMQLTNVAVKLAEENQWLVIHHFLWTVDPEFFGTECIQLWPGYIRAEDGWSKLGAPSGRVLYDREGQSYAAAYAFLGSKSFEKDSLLWGQQSSTDIFAAFSMPNDGENYRGYVAYSMYQSENAGMADCWINYTHQKSWRQYPAQTAMEHRMESTASQNGVFVTKTCAFQFQLWEDLVQVYG